MICFETFYIERCKRLKYAELVLKKTPDIEEKLHRRVYSLYYSR